MAENANERKKTSFNDGDGEGEAKNTQEMDACCATATNNNPAAEPEMKNSGNEGGVGGSEESVDLAALKLKMPPPVDLDTLLMPPPRDGSVLSSERWTPSALPGLASWQYDEDSVPPPVLHNPAPIPGMTLEECLIIHRILKKGVDELNNQFMDYLFAEQERRDQQEQQRSDRNPSSTPQGQGQHDSGMQFSSLGQRQAANRNLAYDPQGKGKQPLSSGKYRLTSPIPTVYATGPSSSSMAVQQARTPNANVDLEEGVGESDDDDLEKDPEDSDG